MRWAEMKPGKETNQAKGILIILAVTLAVGGIAAKVFYNRVVHGNDAQNACINNLISIAGAKSIVAQEHAYKPGKIVIQKDLEPYMFEWRSCPSGGTYTIGPIGTDPTCSIPGHMLPK
jgi:hypothetical protein